MTKTLLRKLSLLTFILMPLMGMAQDTPKTSKGLDERINDWFAPIANWWEGIVFFQVPITATVSVPFVVILLVAGATFFTLYFSFVNIRRFALSIRIVRGKYDFLDKTAVPVNCGYH